MKHVKVSILLMVTALAATFLAGCESWQTDRQDSGYGNYNTHGGYGGHHH